MKSIAIVSDSAFKNNRVNPVGKILSKNIRDVFGSNVHINNYYIDQLTDHDIIKENLILVMASSRANMIKDYVENPSNIIVVKRTFLKSGVYPLFSIPKDTDVLVVNDDIETVLESVSSLYHIGVNHVNLVPFEKGKSYTYIHTAISPSELELIPNYIENKIDVGSRVIDISTILFIIKTLKIQDKETQMNFYDYYQKIFSPNDSIEDNYNNLLVRTEELDFLLDLSHDGILLTDQKGKILIHNKRFREILDITKNQIDKHLHNILPELNFKQYYHHKTIDDLIHYHNKYINVVKKEIIHYNKDIKMYFSFQEVTYIKKLEQNLTHKLRQKGHVAKYTFTDIVSQSKTISTIIEKSKKIAQSDLTVLITGESGTGKEVLAQALHNVSKRKNQPFIAINAAAIPENLLESELFGYAKGSFTGALKDGKKGIFEMASTGTIFLDEIGDMPNHLQSKLLRVLQEKQITPIGADHIIDIDVRIIAATHKNPIEMVETGSFRRDLFYRLNIFPLELPPLRKRKEDILLLLNHFTNYKYNFSDACIEILQAYNWPGNIRELSNVAHYIKTLDEGPLLTPYALPNYIIPALSIQKPVFDSKEQITIPFKKEYICLEEKTNLKISISVLQAIKLLNEINKTSGRKHLLELLKKSALALQESELRRIIKHLDAMDLIIIKKGRTGNFITEKGLQFLTIYQQNS
ncbi:sigma-54 interaction domain-containing protein [Marinisporobacter balticus]|uniref:Transcriptional regulator with PAS, ATPase and Fis domain n=1 Tax=Marinisporobacter balticus TaxID=2018667 RepID=A0A4R2KG25_9FIRM|nr:sigma 54-interacting transcriptional regulator [Marinisporobacter balticus]TCO69349.1 transcriptional regulator with PAS, ATPase and Fis domain [Marinisporobacter balticus]